MANARFIFANDWDEATLSLTGGTASTLLPLINTQRYNNSRVFRTTGTTSPVIKFEFAEPRVVSGIALWRHNLSADAKIRLELFDGPNLSGSKLYDSGLVDALAKKKLGEVEWGLEPLGATPFTNWELAYSVIWFPLTPVHSGRLTITDPLNSEGFLEVCRVYLGRAFEPSVNIDTGHSLRWNTTTDAVRTAGGTLHTQQTAAYRELKVALSHLQVNERAVFFDYVRRVSKHRDFFLSLRPEIGGSGERDYAFAAKFTETPELVSEPGRYTSSLTATEV